MKKIGIFFFTFAFIFAAAGESYACFCKPLWKTPLKKMIADSKNKADAVFVGEVVSIHSSDIDAENARRIIYVKFAVERAWKGVSTIFVEVATAHDGAMCGFAFSMDKKYIVYAKKGETGQLRTSRCSRTELIGRKSLDEKYLGEVRIFTPNKE